MTITPFPGLELFSRLNGLSNSQAPDGALHLACQVKESHPDSSPFWVPVIGHSSFEKAYPDMGNCMIDLIDPE